MHNENIEPNNGDETFEQNLRRLKPVLTATPIEHQLGCADCQRQGGKANEVELLRLAPALVADRDRRYDDAEQAKWHNHEEHPAPIQRLGDEAAHDRPHHWPDHPADSPDHQRHGMQATRKSR